MKDRDKTTVLAMISTMSALLFGLTLLVVVAIVTVNNRLDSLDARLTEMEQRAE